MATCFLSNTKLNKDDYITLQNILEITTMEQGRASDYAYKYKYDLSNKWIYIDDYLLLNISENSFNNIKANGSITVYDDEKYFLLMNGRIYNYAELRDNLISKHGGLNLDRDEDILLALYKKDGNNFVEKLRGMFSIIIWDKNNKTLYGARDHFGTRYLYYQESKKGFCLGSEPNELYFHEYQDGDKINQLALQNYLTFQYVPEPDTMKKNIHALMPGCALERKLNDDVTNIERYWTLELNPIKESQDKKIRDIRESVMESVERHMQDDIPIGCFLSGGVDSAIITALAKDINPNIKCFTAGFDVAGYSEIDLAKEIAEEYKIENISKVISPEEFTNEYPKIVWHMGVPVADPAAIPLYFISKEAKQHIKVVLSGEGADELFGGYNIYREPSSLRIFSNIPNNIKSILLNMAQLIPEGVKGKSFITRGCTPIEKRYVGNAHIFKENEKYRFIKDYDDSYSYDLVTKPYYDYASGYNDIEKMQYIDMNTWLIGDILAKTHKMSNAHALELRSPFLDIKVFEVASKLTSEDKIHGRNTKYLFRKAFRDIIPGGVVGRKKLGYPVPIRVWLKDEIYEWAINTVKQSHADKYIIKEEVIKLINEHRKGHIDNSRKIWTMLTFIIWYQVFCIPGREEEIYESIN